ncbi:MAG TPA: hypothetical protein ENJ09_12580 [Planctomycetes bacterium]|nr:hypothetical protein [Planctomycetota bacterium]
MSGEKRRPEIWVLVSYALAASGVVLIVILGSRPGGALPIFLYRTGTLALGLAAALCATVGFAVSALRRPVLQPGRLAGLLCAVGTLWAASYPLAYPSSHEGHPSRVEFDLPFAGERRVRWAGRRREGNILVLDPSRCFGIAFEPASGSSDPRREPVLAPAPGELVGWLEDAVVVGVGAEEFLVLEGVVRSQGSPSEGVTVPRGGLLGTEGRRGLTMHLEDRPTPGTGEGIPMRLFGLARETGRGPLGSPEPGERVWSALPAPGDPGLEGR